MDDELLAGHMKGLTRGDWLENLFQSMLMSNRDIVASLRNCQIHAATDVTGFGLLGHLLEMLRPLGLGAELFLDKIPIYPGFSELWKLGVRSSLSKANRQNALHLNYSGNDENLEALIDPQTCGGFILALPHVHVDQTLKILNELGFKDSVCIGRVTEKSKSAEMSGLPISEALTPTSPNRAHLFN